MNKSLLLLTAGLLLGACQRYPDGDRAQVSAAHTRPAAAPATPVASVTTVAEAAPATDVPQLAPEALAVLQEQDLGALWQQDPENGRALDGFFGKDRYRIELVLLSVEKDPAQPQVYRITGKDRFKKRITPFEGTFVVTSLKTLTVPKNEQPENFDGGFYTATGKLVLRETPGAKGAGVFEGQLTTDFMLQKGKAERWYGPGTEQSLTQGSGFKFAGQWTDYQTKQVKPVLWADNFLVVASDVLEDFVVGERDVTINPKYARQGWDNYWENDEWWAETPTASL